MTDKEENMLYNGGIMVGVTAVITTILLCIVINAFIGTCECEEEE